MDVLEIYKNSFDPAAYMKNCEIPALWICGANDASFSLDCNQRCADLSKGKTSFSWRANLTHGQQPGDGSGLPEIFAFADYIVKGEDSTLLRIDAGALSDGVITVKAQNSVGIKSAKLYWSEFPGEYWHDSGNVWTGEDCTINGTEITVNVPGNAVFAFVEIVDENNNVISSKVFAF